MTSFGVSCLLLLRREPTEHHAASTGNLPLHSSLCSLGPPGWEDVSAGEGSQSAASAGGPLVSAEPKEADVLRPRLEGEVRALTAHVVCRDGCLQLPRDLGCALGNPMHVILVSRLIGVRAVQEMLIFDEGALTTSSLFIGRRGPGGCCLNKQCATYVQLATQHVPGYAACGYC